MKNRPVENEGVKLAVLAAGIGMERQVPKKDLVQFASGKTAVEDFAINTDGDGAKIGGVKCANELARVTFPDGEKGGHAHAREVFLAIGAQVFEENVAEGDSSNAFVVVHTQCLFHPRFVDGIDALRRNENFVERQANGFRLPLQ